MRIRKPGRSMPNWKGGISKHRAYYIWHKMMRRCYNNSDPEYNNYGGRGIVVCKDWQNITSFIIWSKNNGCKDSLEIDRIDNMGNYSPSNCRFVTRLKNAQNTRASKRWYIKGNKFDSMRSAAKALNVSTRSIKMWCDGLMDHGIYYPPKPNCWSEKLYKE